MQDFPKFEEIQDISKIELIKWLGSDATKDDLLNILLEVVNGFYEPHYLFNDIRDFIKDN